METKPSKLVFSIATESWYFTSRTLREGCAEEVFFGRRVEGDGCLWEAALRWYEFRDGKAPSLRVEVFYDAFAAFAESPGLFMALAGLHGKPLDVAQAAALLKEHGFSDATERVGPNGLPSLRKLERAAPALYEALAKARCHIPTPCDDPECDAIGCSSRREVLERIDAALALARGESPSPEATQEVKP